jgi:hypothetical protein
VGRRRGLAPDRLPALDGWALAMMYLLETDRTLYYLKGGYDPGFERHPDAPARVGA